MLYVVNVSAKKFESVYADDINCDSVHFAKYI